jgi:hypothetical protein
MAIMPVTQPLIEQAKQTLALMEKRLATDPNDEWCRQAVLDARQRLEAVLRLLNKEPKAKDPSQHRGA